MYYLINKYISINNLKLKNMKTFDLLMKINGYDICKGVSWTNSEYKLTILKGTLKKNKYYYHIFNNSNEAEYADVILMLGTDEKQYLFEIDR